MTLNRCVPLAIVWAIVNLIISPCPRALAEDKPTMVTVIADSMVEETLHGSTVQVEFQNISLSDIEHLELVTADGQRVLNLSSRPAIDVTVFIPDSLSPEERSAFLTNIETHLNRQHQSAVYRVRPLAIPVAVEKAMALNEPTPTERKSWSERTRAIAHALKNNRFNTRAKDFTMGALIGLSKSVGGVTYWLGVTGVNPYGLAQAAMSVGLDTIFHVFPAQINRWKGTHQFPWFKDSKAVKFYNSSPLAKALVINQAIHFTTTYGFRMLSHLDDPERVTSPNSVEFLSLFGGMAAIGTPLGAAGDMGVRTLARKGYISGRTEHYIFNLFGLEMQINGLLFGSGRTEWLPIGLGIEWGGKALSWLLAKVLPAKQNRLVILHPEVAAHRRSDVLYLMGFENLMTPEDLRASTAPTLKAKNYRLRCADLLAR